jgi:oxalate decarboxylase/phosphoglucose isomerase-like protein (cupin superfamily)
MKSSAQTDPMPSAGPDEPKPLILGPDEGERLVRRWGYPLIIKVDRFNGGSRQFCAGTEDVGPGKAIPVHRHPHADELVIIMSGRALASLGTAQREIGAGSIVYSPRGNWMGFQNIGEDCLRICWIFCNLGFEDYVRATSVSAGAPLLSLAHGELMQIRQRFTGVIELRDEFMPDYNDVPVTPNALSE